MKRLSILACLLAISTLAYGARQDNILKSRENGGKVILSPNNVSGTGIPMITADPGGDLTLEAPAGQIAFDDEAVFNGGVTGIDISGLAVSEGTVTGTTPSPATLATGTHYIYDMTGATGDATVTLPAGADDATIRVTIINNPSDHALKIDGNGSEKILYGDVQYDDANLRNVTGWVHFVWDNTNSYWVADDSATFYSGNFNGDLEVTGYLHLTGSQKPIKFTNGNGDIGATDSAFIFIDTDDNQASGNRFAVYADTDDQGSGTQLFQVGDTGDVTVPSGHLGIGTAPSYRVHAQGTQNSNGTEEFVRLQGGDGNTGRLKILSVRGNTPPDRALQLQAEDGQNNDVILHLQPEGGNVGIGSKTGSGGSHADALLQVNGTSGTNPVVSLKGAIQDVESEIIRFGRSDSNVRYHSLKMVNSSIGTNNWMAFSLHDASASTTSQHEVLRMFSLGGMALSGEEKSYTAAAGFQGTGRYFPGTGMYMVAVGTSSHGNWGAWYCYYNGTIIEANSIVEIGDPEGVFATPAIGVSSGQLTLDVTFNGTYDVNIIRLH